VEELYGTRYQSGSISLINVGSGFHCLRSFLFFSFFFCFYEMKANSSIAGNKCADAIAKLCLTDLQVKPSVKALLYTTVVMTCTFKTPASDGNAYTHLYWLAAIDTDEEPSRRRGTSTPRLPELSDVKAKLKTECANHTDWGVPKQTQRTTTSGRTSDRWSISFHWFWRTSHRNVLVAYILANS
jgi:hypothetical protein